MNTVKSEYHSRRLEAKEYVKFVCTLIEREEKFGKSFVEINGAICRHSILKTNTLLILYNIIESTARAALTAIYAKIYDLEIPFEKCSQELRKVLVQDIKKYINFKNFEEAINGEHLFFTNLYQNAYNRKDFFSGNIDVKLLKTKSEEYGFSSFIDNCARQAGRLAQRIGRKSQIEDCILIIKNKRNALMHGEVSFQEVGRELSVSDLKHYYLGTILILGLFVKHVEIFLNEKKYLDTNRE